MAALRTAEALDVAYDELVAQATHKYLAIPCLMGGVGIGKTEGALNLCIRMNEFQGDMLQFEPIASGEASDPTDISGIPWVITETQPDTGSHVYKVLWALNRAAYQAHKVPTFLLFDDIDKAPSIIINSLLHLFVNRSFKDFKLHEKSLIMCAGNRASDDISANTLSESMRTRVTIIEMEPHITDFSEWAMRVPEGAPSLIHPYLLGFLQGKPEHLFAHDEKANRFPTPRGYREASILMYMHPPTKWKAIIERKVGMGVANDFWVWYSILRNIDVDYLLEHGTLKEPVAASGDTPLEVARKLGEFAAVFAVTDRLNVEVKPQYAGIPRFVDELSAELRTAVLLQLNQKAREAFKKVFATTSALIVKGIVQGVSST